MSALPATNGETVKEMLRRAKVAHWGADAHHQQGREHWEFANRGNPSRDYVHVAELALKAVYVKHEQPFERTHDIGDLYQNCPDPNRSAVPGLGGAALRTFSSWYLSPYSIERRATEQDLANRQEISNRIVRWAEDVVYGRKRRDTGTGSKEFCTI